MAGDSYRIVGCDRRVMDSPDEPSLPRSRAITGRCEHCEWNVVADSYPAVVEAYQNHLRESHPKLWLRT